VKNRQWITPIITLLAETKEDLVICTTKNEARRQKGGLIGGEYPE